MWGHPLAPLTDQCPWHTYPLTPPAHARVGIKGKLFRVAGAGAFRFLSTQGRQPIPLFKALLLASGSGMIQMKHVSTAPRSTPLLGLLRSRKGSILLCFTPSPAIIVPTFATVDGTQCSGVCCAARHGVRGPADTAREVGGAIQEKEFGCLELGVNKGMLKKR